MKRRSVFKGTNVTKEADQIIERICAVGNYYKLHINGDDKLNTSALIGYIFEDIAASKNKPQKLRDFLKILSIKDNRGEPINQEKLDEIIEDVLGQ